MRVDIKLIAIGILAFVITISAARAEQELTVTGGQIRLPDISDRGGPDGGGYYFLDSPDSAFNAPRYNWQEISVIGTDMGITLDDQNIGPFSIGFNFNFYGNIFNSFNACSNGFLSFTSTSNAYENDTIPSPAEPNNLIAVYWDDLLPSTGHAYYYSNGVDTLIVEWQDFVYLQGNGPVTFEAILTANGNITCQYQSIGYPINSHTIGIENGSGTIGLQYVANITSNETDKAILFSRAAADYHAHSVLVIAADTASAFISQLQGFGDIQTVSYFDARNGFPPLSYLQNFDAAVVWSNFTFENPTVLGNVLADYMEGGGAVILYQSCFYGMYRLQGRLIDQYSPFNYSSNALSSRHLSHTPFTAGHPIFAGVDSIYEPYSTDVTIAHNAMPIAEFTDGTPFVAVDQTHKLVAINGTVVNSRPFTDDMIALSHNAINFAISNPAEIVLLVADINATSARRDLLLFPDILGVDIFDVRLGMPSFEFLSAYQAAVVWSNYAFWDSAGLGNMLADYVDSSRGVVLANFDFSNSFTGLGGRLMSSYSPLGTGTLRTQTRGLGIHNHNNPFMINVDTVTDYYTCASALRNGGVSVANWDDGMPFVVYNPTRKVVAINGYIGQARQFTGDMMTVIHNSINYARGYTSIDENAELPGKFQLMQNYPNPFNATTEISYDLSENSVVKLEIFNLLGQKVTTLVNEPERNGRHSVIWNGRDTRGGLVASGVYFYRLDTGINQAAKKMLLLK